MPALPVPRQLPRRQPQHVRGQVLDLHPFQQQVARVAHHQLQALAEVLPFPADEAVAARQPPRREVEQQAAQQAPLPVPHPVAQMRAQRLAIAQRMIALHPLVPQRHLLALGHRLQPHRGQRGQRLPHGRLGRAASVEMQRLLRPPSAALPGRQLYDAQPLQLPQHAQAEAQAGRPAGRVPPHLLAHGPRQLGAAELGEELHRLLDLGQRTAAQTLAAEGRGGQIAEARIHAGQWQGCIFTLAKRKPIVKRPRKLS